MGIYSVLEFVRGQLDGLTSPHYEPAVAILKPPVGYNLIPGSPVINVWFEPYREDRKTVPRAKGGVLTTAGFKAARHTVCAYVAIADDPTAAHAGQAFFQTLDSVMNKLRLIDLPATLTDPDTGIVTNLTILGEEFTVTPDVVRTLKDQRYVRYLARVSTGAYEQLQS